jgi:hypothetical protein
MPNQRNLDSLQALIEGKDQRFIGGIIVPIHNHLAGATTVYFEKRPGLELIPLVDCLGEVAEGCAATAIFYSRTTGKYITAFCDELYVDCGSAGGVTPDPVASDCLDDSSEFFSTRDVTGFTLSSDYLTATQTSAGTRGNVRVTTSRSSGSFYFEFEASALSGIDSKFGIRSTGTAIADQWDTGDTITINSSGTWNVSFSGATVNYSGSSFSAGDRVQIALNLSSGTMWQRVNGGSWGSGADPETGDNPQVSGIPSDNWKIYYGCDVLVAGADASQVYITDSSWQDLAPLGFCTWKLIGWNQSDTSFVTSDNREVQANNFGSNGGWRRLSVARTGKKYFEFLPVESPSNGFCVGVIAQSTYSGTAYTTNPYGLAGCYVITNESAIGYVPGRITNGNITSDSQYNFAVGDVIGVAIDYDNFKVWFAKNNTWISGDPAAGNSPTFTLASGAFDPIGMNRGHNNGTHRSRVSFLTAHLTYEPPTGFSVFGG